MNCNQLTGWFRLLVLLLPLMASQSCQKGFDNPDFILNADVMLAGFSLHGNEATIDQEQAQINLIMPFGTTVDEVVPEMMLPDGSRVQPDASQPQNFSNPVRYTVINGNLYRDYTVHVTVQPPFTAFSINDISGSIDHSSRTVSVVLAAGTDLSALTPEVTLTEGVSVTPPSGEPANFNESVVYSFGAQGQTVDYTVSVTLQVLGIKVAYLGTGSSRSQISNPDEQAAANWLFSSFQDAEYLSFSDVSGGKELSTYDVIWWHHDAAIELPGIALDNDITTRLKNYRQQGGTLLLTSFATTYLEALDIVPTGHNPNNVFGDFLPAGFVDHDNSWAISFRGREDHPLFAGIQTYEQGKAYFLERGTFRLNHTAWWVVDWWASETYGTGARWREITGGINLASEEWDDELNGRVAIAEFPGNEVQGNVVTVSFGAYDWFNEPDAAGNPSRPNAYIHNIRTLTENALKYLAEN